MKGRQGANGAHPLIWRDRTGTRIGNSKKNPRTQTIPMNLALWLRKILWVSTLSVWNHSSDREETHKTFRVMFTHAILKG